MEKVLFDLTTKDVRRSAYHFAMQLRINNRFGIENKLADRD